MGSTSDRMDHEYFLELAALSEMGELSSGEYAELQRHLQECFSCRSEQAAFADILLNQLPLAHHEKHDCVPDVGTSQLSSWYRPVHFLAKPVPLYTHAVALLLILLGIVGYGRHEVARFRKVGVVSITKSSSQVGAEPGLLDYPVRKMSPVDNTGTTRPSSVSSGANVSRASSAGNQISINGTEFARLVAHSNSLWEELKNVKSQLEVLRQELGAAQDREGNLSLRVEESNESLARITSGLESARAVHTKDEATILEKEGELTAIQEELASTKESLTRSQMYLTADRDIRDLMGARNLRIIDVFDVDGKGKTKRPFGRIFFTEGRSLIFYAFDLENAKPSFAAASYQGWGYQGGTQSAVRSLGIFYQDDQKANRWVLKFDDPEVLTEIDSVFVTIEPPGGSKKPTGNRLLAAYMKANLNHP